MACAVYADDMYVELDYSRKTLRTFQTQKRGSLMNMSTTAYEQTAVKEL